MNNIVKLPFGNLNVCSHQLLRQKWKIYSTYFSISKDYTVKLLPSVLTSEEREKSLQPLLNSKDWKLMDDKDAIQKTFKFKNFNQAFGFMTRVAMASEKLDHHPDWSNVYNSVTVLWTTHCSGGITANDVKMATFCDNIFAKF